MANSKVRRRARLGRAASHLDGPARWVEDPPYGPLSNYLRPLYPLNAAGEYSRPASQVRELRERYGPDVEVQYRVRKKFENRASALDYEREFLERFKRLYGEYPGEGLPGGNKTNR